MVDRLTIRKMMIYGKENVRGGNYSAIDQNIINKKLGIELCDKIDKSSISSNSTKDIKKDHYIINDILSNHSGYNGHADDIELHRENISPGFKRLIDSQSSKKIISNKKKHSKRKK